MVQPSLKKLVKVLRAIQALVVKNVEQLTGISSYTRPDPFVLLASQLAQVRSALFDLLGSSSPALDEIAKYYFLRPSKQLSSIPTKTSPFSEKWDIYATTTASSASQKEWSGVLPAQMRLAQIVEMIHAASLLHDDVIDESPLRRGTPSAPQAYGSKLAVLGGNFILGHASAALARLGDPEVVELIASIISNLVEGEILQMQEAPAPANAWRVYLQKTYMKTASLMARGARGAVVLGGCVEGEMYREVAYAYGGTWVSHFSSWMISLDYESGEATLGKPGGADLQLGLATGPALFAWEEHPQIGPLIERKFNQPDDVELARDYVRKSSGVERTRDLAFAYAKQARDVLAPLPDSDAKGALEALTERVVKRKS
ncbi:isoprenoid synthase domain-containing protein [Armillaria borealis]|uniref:(2E,6E)-farnesyl diphosphate synthase n=1 Tax=Armillaria borealis TaxID=47425 RepID=A0AA39JV41_9AGAR|nr:isoprenoid synthase domain-containing protein [Armillaria borealis]